ncbi:alpha/beta-hydrolase [Macrolepiota fuliginosa MF-IS2]|uniref:Carboxylic ester hydrolase n=1 Tax=Macrolepiota fuliginosa MF-IS2 TaxID=1400762 RepID=A0A9P5XC19_9AGAR|nr:alpha/beta-hydrolase [Macrolepiota fuliginosa MF-IS2]
MTRLISFLVAASSLLAFVRAQDINGLTVQTQQGTVIGSLALPTVRRFLGLPYATAGRWQLPASPSTRSTALNATQFGDSCTQKLDSSSVEFLTLSGAGAAPVPESDNCLNLNIWTPIIGRKQGTAVLLWIFGGSFQFGTSNFAAYDGANFVRDHDDITIVTINYRTNIFGQPNAPQLVSSTQTQNFGLLDIEAAIRWVHSNIAVFGGDPERITIFGQSAGSAAVDAYAYSHPSDTIVKGIITQSGTLDLLTSIPIARIGVDDPDTGAWNQIANTVGCGSSATPGQLTCMRAVDAHTLEQATIDSGTTFAPIVDDITIFSDVRQRAADGNFLHVPMLGGTTAQEADIFVVAEELLTTGIVIPVVTPEVSDIVTKVAFTCPASTAASDRSQAGVPTWRYQYQAVFPDISQRSDLRAYHSSDIPVVFATYNASTASAGPTASEIALSRFVQTAWVTFARDPANGLGSAPFSWPKVNNGGNNAVLLGNSANPGGATFTSSSTLDSDCGTIDTLVALYNLLGINVSL